MTIQTESEEYTWAEVALATGGIFRATLVNQTDRPFRATLGDAFNSAPGQETLWLAEGSDGFLEQRVHPSEWKSLQRPLLIEGVSTIVIRPHGTYTLLGHVVGAKVTGTFRLRVQYSDGAENGPADATHQDYSNAFTIN